MIVKGEKIPVYNEQVFSYWNNNEDQIGGSLSVSTAAFYQVRDEKEILRHLFHRAKGLGKRHYDLMCSEAGWANEQEWYEQYQYYS